jgi:hypothetical protein
VSYSFGYISRSGIAGSNGRSIFRFLKSLQIFSRMVVLVYIPTSMYKGSFFSTYSLKPVGGGVSNDGYSNRGEVES